MNVRKNAGQSKGKKKNKEKLTSIVTQELGQSPQKKKKSEKLRIPEDFNEINRNIAESGQSPKKKKKSEKLRIQEDFNERNRNIAELGQSPKKKKKSEKLRIQEDFNEMNRNIAESESTTKKKKRKLSTKQTFFDQMYEVSRSGVSDSSVSPPKRKNSQKIYKQDDISADSDILVSPPKMTSKKMQEHQDSSTDADTLTSPLKRTSKKMQEHQDSSTDADTLTSPLKRTSKKMQEHQDSSTDADFQVSPKKRKNSQKIYKHGDISDILMSPPKRTSKKMQEHQDSSTDAGHKEMSQKYQLKKELVSPSSADEDDDDLYSSLDDIKPENVEELSFKAEIYEEENEIGENEIGENEIEGNEIEGNEIEENENEDIGETSIQQHFTVEDPSDQKIKLNFLQILLENLAPTSSNYLVDISNFNFESLGEKMQMDANECKAHLKSLIEKTPKVKCLHQIVSETLVHLPNKRSTTSFSLFLRQHPDEINEVMKSGKAKNRMAAAAMLWNNLTQEVKNSYKKPENSVTNLGKLPVMFFYDKQVNKGKNSLCNARKKYAALKPEKKIKYILKSIQLLMEVNPALKKNQANSKNGQQTLKKDVKLRVPSKSELKLLLGHFNFPEVPPKIPSLLYFKENPEAFPDDHMFHGGAKLVSRLKVFRSLDRPTQKIWVARHEQVWSDFMKEVKVWNMDRIPELTYASDLYLKRELKSSPKKQNILDGLVHISMADFKIKFPNEPSPPPITRHKCFEKDMEQRTKEKLPYNRIRMAYSALDSEMKHSYEKKAKLNRSTYIKELLKVVKNLSEEQRRIFLGTRRVKYIKLFKEDIFFMYASKDYPVYEAPPRTSTTRSSNNKRVKRKSNARAPKKTDITEDARDSKPDEAEMESDQSNNKRVTRKSNAYTPSKKDTSDDFESEDQEEMESDQLQEFSLHSEDGFTSDD